MSCCVVAMCGMVEVLLFVVAFLAQCFFSQFEPTPAKEVSFGKKEAFAKKGSL